MTAVVSSSTSVLAGSFRGSGGVVGTGKGATDNVELDVFASLSVFA